MKKVTVLYMRVSSESQNLSRQKEALKIYSSRYKNLVEIVEKISGSVKAQDREFERIFSMNVDTVIIQDIDRLGRNTIDILSTIKRLTDHKINLIVVSLGMETLLVNGEENQAFKIVISVMSTLAELERTKIRERQKQGIAIARKKGKYKGRKIGTKESKYKFLSKYQNITNDLIEGKSKKEILQNHSISRSTLNKIISYSNL